MTAHRAAVCVIGTWYICFPHKASSILNSFSHTKSVSCLPNVTTCFGEAYKSFNPTHLSTRFTPLDPTPQPIRPIPTLPKLVFLLIRLLLSVIEELVVIQNQYILEVHPFPLQKSCEENAEIRFWPMRTAWESSLFAWI